MLKLMEEKMARTTLAAVETLGKRKLTAERKDVLLQANKKINRKQCTILEEYHIQTSGNNFIRGI